MAASVVQTTNDVFYHLAQVDPLTLTFQLSPTVVGYANTLRRMVLIGTESVGFRSDMNDKGATTDVKIIENTTPMTNEMLADRIGLLPLAVEDPVGWDPEEFSFHLDITNDTEVSKDVTTADIQVRQKQPAGQEPVLVANTRFFHPDPITKEYPLIAVLKGKQGTQVGQKIAFEAKATVGQGRDHIRFCPVSQCSYAYTVDADEARQKTFFERWLVNNKKTDPKSLEEDGARKEKLEREFQTMEVQRCFKVNEKGEPYSFDFTVETLGIQSIPLIVEHALVNLVDKCTSYTTLDQGKPDTVKVQPADARMKGFDFIFQCEDHTLGNLLQTWMEDNLIDGGEITFVGYKVPHPLRDEMVLRVGVDDGKEITARAMVARAATQCAEMFRGWLENWRRVTAEGFGRRTRESLRPNLTNAKALEAAANAASTASTASSARSAATAASTPAGAAAGNARTATSTRGRRRQ